MSSKEIALSARGLSKSYSLAHNALRHNTIAEALMYRLKHPFQRQEKETFWALKEVDFDIQQGDVVGIIGRNGAGKSTLLKILSRITEPTAGQVDLYGRVGSLLEVGTGFHPELTGRENIYLNGAILGMRRREIDAQFDAIVDFAGVAQFLDTPVKRYSSGMYVRLAFAVAAHLNPEILVVDEVLAVGDIEFQKKCLGKMQDVAHSGRTVLFVSHNMNAVTSLCRKGLVLQNGQVAYFGEIEQAVKRYLDSFLLANAAESDPQKRSGSGEYRFLQVSPDCPVYDSGDEITVRFSIQGNGRDLGKMYVSAHLVDEFGRLLAQCDSRLTGTWLSDQDRITGAFRLKSLWLKPGQYRLDMFICVVSAVPIIDKFEDACRITISPLLPYPSSAPEDSLAQGLILADFDWETGEEHE